MKTYHVGLVLLLLLAAPVEAQIHSPLGRPLPRRNAAAPNPQPAPQPVPFPDQAKWNEQGELIEDKTRHDVFIGPALELSQLNGSFAMLAGARGGWIIKHRYSLGLAGFGLLNEVEGNPLDSGIQPDLLVKYGGVELEYIVNPKDVVHFSFSTLIGMGLVEYDYAATDGDDSFLVIKPSANLIVNLTEFLRVGFGLGYRLASGVELENLEDGDLSGFAATLSLNFGTFGKTLIE